MALAFAALLAGPALSAQAPADAGRDSFSQAMSAYSADQLAKALPLFALAARESPGEAARHAWYAETARRLDSMALALAESRRALALDSCSSFAHTVVAALYNPQFSLWGSTNADTTWAHLNAAIG